MVRPGLPVDAVRPEEEPVDVQALERGHRDRSHQRVGRGPHPAGEDDDVRRSLDVVEQLGHGDGVRDDGEVRHVADARASS